MRVSPLCVIVAIRQGGDVSKDNEAGGSAKLKYRDLTRSWHRRHRALFSVLGAICGLIVVSSLVAARVWPGISWTLGFLGGSAVAFLLLAWMSPPGWIENWEVGAWGEEATGRELARLDQARWSVFHDVPTERGNIDHLVVGPGGVFVLDSKRVGGRVIVQDDEIRVQRLDDGTLWYAHGGAAGVRRLAAQTSQRMLAATHIKVWVTPVLVMWADFPQRLVEDACVVVHGDELVSWLEQLPVRVAPQHVARVAEAARSAWGV